MPGREERLEVTQEYSVIGGKALSCYISGLGVDCVTVMVYSLGGTCTQLSISQTSVSTKGCAKGRREGRAWFPDVPVPAVSQLIQRYSQK